jgi:hypothetical protein
VAPGRRGDCSVPVSVRFAICLRHRNRHSHRDAFAVGDAVRIRVAIAFGHGLAVSLRVPDRHAGAYLYPVAFCHGNVDCHTHSYSDAYPHSDTLAYDDLCRPGRVVDRTVVGGTGCLRLQRPRLR